MNLIGYAIFYLERNFINLTLMSFYTFCTPYFLQYRSNTNMSLTSIFLFVPNIREIFFEINLTAWILDADRSSDLGDQTHNLIFTVQHNCNRPKIQVISRITFCSCHLKTAILKLNRRFLYKSHGKKVNNFRWQK